MEEEGARGGREGSGGRGGKMIGPNALALFWRLIMADTKSRDNTVHNRRIVEEGGGGGGGGSE